LIDDGRRVILVIQSNKLECMKVNLKKFKKSTWLIAGLGFLVGALVILGIRFVTYHNPKGVHYHANFVIYVDGQKQELKEPFYYEEVGAGCDPNEKMTPHERAHMHDNVNNVVHVHDNAVTWGNFFQNIGWVIDTKLLEDPHGKVYLADGQSKVTFMLNGKTTDNVINQVIGDQDRLLVSFGISSNQDLQSQYNSVPATAHKYDISKDPASCGGGVVPTTTSDRFKHLL
jgi:hypothetical protein